MLTAEKHIEVLRSGLMVDHFYLLCQIKAGESPVAHPRVQGYINLLTKKEYLDDDGALTDKAYTLIDGYEMVQPKSEMAKAANAKIAEWIAVLHQKCIDKLVALTGKKQITDKIDKKSYSFMPNYTDFHRVLMKVIKLYKITDFPKVERTILNYIEKCNESGNWFPILGYYIYKNNSSTMVTDMESIDDEIKVETVTTQKFV